MPPKRRNLWIDHRVPTGGRSSCSLRRTPTSPGCTNPTAAAAFRASLPARERRNSELPLRPQPARVMMEAWAADP